MKLIKIALAFSLIFGCVSFSSAQTSGKKKIVVTKKVTEEDGKVVTKQVILEGDEAEQYMKDKDESGLRFIEKKIKAEEGSGSTERREVVIRVREKGGEEKVIKWNGDGEIPAEIQEKLDENNITIDVEESVGGEVRVMVNSSEERTLLGVVTENHVDGVQILDVIQDSQAEKAGLQKGDIIYEVGGKTVGSSVQVKAQLDKVGEGGKTSILFLRNGEKQSIEVDL